MPDTIKMEGWSIVGAAASPYSAPEQASTMHLFGRAYGHPRHKDGTPIKTTAIVEAVGRQVRTVSGSVYELGAPDSLYVEWLAEQGKSIDESAPVKL